MSGETEIPGLPARRFAADVLEGVLRRRRPLDVPDHAAVDLSVRLARADRRAARYAGLVNAVLRRIAEHGRERLKGVDTVALDTPPWLMARWTRAYGVDTARAIAQANGH